MRSNVSFKSNDLILAGHLYVPDDYKKGEKRTAMVVSHPFTGVKEQTAGLYAKKLSEKGYITLAFDASYQGESEGEPRYLEDPFARAEDIKSAVSYLESRDEVDEQGIGALGICASGGYVPSQPRPIDVSRPQELSAQWTWVISLEKDFQPAWLPT